MCILVELDVDTYGLNEDLNANFYVELNVNICELGYGHLWN